MLIVGFDPGGLRQFGWCLLAAQRQLPIRLQASGLSDNAAGALSAVRASLGDSAPDAVGIDSPLFWVPDGDRHADTTVRNAIKQAGAKHSAGTVQQVNSLRGACLTQGILAAHLARTAWPAVRITETHPKALLWLMGIATKSLPPSAVTTRHLAEYLAFPSGHLSEHERDAALGGFAAWAMLVGRRGWRNLAHCEPEAFRPVDGIEYWMPGEAAEQGVEADEA